MCAWAPPTGSDRSPFARELRVALDAVRAACDVVAALAEGEVAVEWKSYDDPVTAADRASNEILARALGDAFPDDAVCAEESPTDVARAAAARTGRVWFVDPLDGTKDFVARNGEYCVMAGLAVEGRPVLGVIGYPSRREAALGIPDVGTWLLGDGGLVTPLVNRVGESDPIRTVVGSRSRPSEAVRAVAAAVGATVVPCGSVGLKVLRVARGECSAYVHLGGGPKLWDGCAPEALALGAGLVCSDEAGEPLQYGPDTLELRRGIVVAPPGLHARLLAAIDGT